MTLPEWFDAKDVQGVIKLTARDDEGVTYSVSVGLRSLALTAVEEGEAQLLVWHKRVEFGQKPSNVAGGHLFVEAAREQEDIGREISSLVWPR